MGKFSKLADDVLGNDWRSRLGEQENRLRKYIPTSRDEALSKAKSILKQLQEKSYMAGVEAHLANRAAQPQIPIMKPTMSGVPGRQVTISSGEPKAALQGIPKTSAIMSGTSMMDSGLVGTAPQFASSRPSVTSKPSVPPTIGNLGALPKVRPPIADKLNSLANKPGASPKALNITSGASASNLVPRQTSTQPRRVKSSPSFQPSQIKPEVPQVGEVSNVVPAPQGSPAPAQGSGTASVGGSSQGSLMDLQRGYRPDMAELTGLSQGQGAIWANKPMTDKENEEWGSRRVGRPMTSVDRKAFSNSRGMKGPIPDFDTWVKSRGKEEPKSAGVLDMAMNPAIEMWEDAKSNLAKRLDATRLSAMQTTADPGTIPWFYPSVASSVPKSFMRGYRETDKALDEEQARKLTEELESAKLDFEKSLAEEYTSSHPKTAGELIDGLAQAHVKQAEGELNQAMGVYLALATLLGEGTHEFAKNWVEKRDPKRQEYKALRSAVLRRMQNKPIQIQAAPPVLEPIELDV